MPGRARDERIDAAVLAAARNLLDTKGYAGLSIGQVAADAGVHRPAIYRRWPSKRHLVVDVVADLLGLSPTPDSGDLREDMLRSMRELVTALRDTSLGQVLPALVADLAADPELRDQLWSSVFGPRRESTARALRSAIDRGEIDPDLDLDFVLDALAAPIYFRALFGHLPLSDDLAQRAVETVLASIRVPRSRA